MPGTIDDNAGGRRSTDRGSQMSSGHADAGWDDYQERVLRNEGRLAGLEQLVAETREADRKLIEQRSASLSDELERRAESLTILSDEQRSADQREYRAELAAHERIADQRWQAHQALLEQYNEMATRLYKEVADALHAETQQLDAKVSLWRESDKAARDLQAAEYERRLGVLNHANARQIEFQGKSVTRELFQSEKEAQAHREQVLRDQLIALDRALLGMTPQASSERANAALNDRITDAVAASARTLDTKVETLKETLTEVKSYVDTTRGRSAGYSQLYAWAIGAVGLIISVVIAANVIAG
jgi:hypothetical protein